MNLSDIIKNGSAKGYELLTLTANYTLNISRNNIFEINSNAEYTISIPTESWTGQEIILFNTSGYDIRLNLNDSSSKSCLLKHNNIYRVLSLQNNDIDELICIEEQEQFLIDYSDYTEQKIMASDAKIMASDAEADDNFSTISEISGDGNTIVIGATSEDTGGVDAGAAYVFVRSGNTWTQQQKLQASDKQAGDNFGNMGSNCISYDGNTIVVGAYREDTGGVDAGAAYVFTRSGSTWTQQQKLQASDKQAGDLFGISPGISGDGNTILVGAYHEDTGGVDAGAAYVFTRSGNTWTQQQKLQASDKQASDLFGALTSLSYNGNIIAVTAQAAGSYLGAVYVYIKNGLVWSNEQKIQPNDIAAGDYFGSIVDLNSDGDTLIISSRFEDTGGVDAGAVYIFVRIGTTWSQQTKFISSDIQASDYFGIWACSISSDGNTCVVGAYGEDTGGSNAGAAYIFTRSGSTWTQQQKLMASDKQAGDWFGLACSISDDGNTCIISASGEDTGGSNAGAAYIFDFNL